LQAFLSWADQKTNSVKFSYKPAAVRAFYAFVEAINLDHNLAFAIDYNLDLQQDLDRDLVIDLSLDRDLVYALAHDLARTSFQGQAQELARAIDRASNLSDDVLRQALQALKSQLPINGEEFYQWWLNHWERCRNELRQICIDYRNIGHDWQFTKEQIKLLSQYYEANLLLVECMNRSNISKQVREEIESTLLLPVLSIPNIENFV
jgi:predicted NACHT family NTPase